MKHAVGVSEFHILVNLLHLGEFCSPCTVGCYDTVIAKVTLMRSRIVITGCVMWESVLFKHTILYSLRVIDRLIYPIPYTTAAPSMGLSRMPKGRNKAPAAMGIPRQL